MSPYTGDHWQIFRVESNSTQCKRPGGIGVTLSNESGYLRIFPFCEDGSRESCLIVAAPPSRLVPTFTWDLIPKSHATIQPITTFNTLTKTTRETECRASRASSHLKAEVSSLRRGMSALLMLERHAAILTNSAVESLRCVLHAIAVLGTELPRVATDCIDIDTKIFKTLITQYQKCQPSACSCTFAVNQFDGKTKWQRELRIPAHRLKLSADSVLERLQRSCLRQLQLRKFMFHADMEENVQLLYMAVTSPATPPAAAKDHQQIKVGAEEFDLLEQAYISSAIVYEVCLPGSFEGGQLQFTTEAVSVGTVNEKKCAAIAYWRDQLLSRAVIERGNCIRLVYSVCITRPSSGVVPFPLLGCNWIDFSSAHSSIVAVLSTPSVLSCVSSLAHRPYEQLHTLQIQLRLQLLVRLVQLCSANPAECRLLASLGWMQFKEQIQQLAVATGNDSKDSESKDDSHKQYARNVVTAIYAVNALLPDAIRYHVFLMSESVSKFNGSVDVPCILSESVKHVHDPVSKSWIQVQQSHSRLRWLQVAEEWSRSTKDILATYGKDRCVRAFICLSADHARLAFTPGRVYGAGEILSRLLPSLQSSENALPHWHHALFAGSENAAISELRFLLQRMEAGVGSMLSAAPSAVLLALIASGDARSLFAYASVTVNFRNVSASITEASDSKEETRVQANAPDLIMLFAMAVHCAGGLEDQVVYSATITLFDALPDSHVGQLNCYLRAYFFAVLLLLQGFHNRKTRHSTKFVQAAHGSGIARSLLSALRIYAPVTLSCSAADVSHNSPAVNCVRLASTTEVYRCVANHIDDACRNENLGIIETSSLSQKCLALHEHQRLCVASLSNADPRLRCVACSEILMLTRTADSECTVCGNVLKGPVYSCLRHDYCLCLGCSVALKLLPMPSASEDEKNEQKMMADDPSTSIASFHMLTPAERREFLQEQFVLRSLPVELLEIVCDYTSPRSQLNCKSGFGSRLLNLALQSANEVLLSLSHMDAKSVPATCVAWMWRGCLLPHLLNELLPNSILLQTNLSTIGVLHAPCDARRRRLLERIILKHVLISKEDGTSLTFQSTEAVQAFLLKTTQAPQTHNIPPAPAASTLENGSGPSSHTSATMQNKSEHVLVQREFARFVCLIGLDSILLPFSLLECWLGQLLGSDGA